jgi:hypothetical protein
VTNLVLSGISSRVRILDTIVFDVENRAKPLYWIFTNTSGVLESRSVRHMLLEDVLASFRIVLKKGMRSG